MSIFHGYDISSSTSDSRLLDQRIAETDAWENGYTIRADDHPEIFQPVEPLAWREPSPSPASPVWGIVRHVVLAIAAAVVVHLVWLNYFQ